MNDTEAPAITCPAAITTSNDPGDCSAVVTYTTPVGTDNCDNGVTNGTVTMSNQTGTYSGSARGYVFTAPSDFTITSLRVPTLASGGDQSIMVMRFAGPVGEYPNTSSYEDLLFYTGLDSNSGFIPVNIPIEAGDVIGILGNRNDVNSYTTDSTITIDGNSVNISRFLTQNSISSGAAPQGSFTMEALNSSKSNVDFEYTTESNILVSTQTAGLPSGSDIPSGNNDQHV